MRHAPRSLRMITAGALVLGAPLVASAAWDLERSGPHAQHRVDVAPTADAPKEARSMAPKAGVAMQRPVGPPPASLPQGSRSLAPKKGAAFSRPVAPPGAGSGSPGMPIAAD